MNVIVKGKWEYKSEEKKSIIQNVEMFYKPQETFIKIFDNFSSMVFESKFESSSWKRTQSINS